MPDFLDLYLGGLPAFEGVLRSWWLRDDSAFAASLCRLAVDERQEIVGCYFSMPGHELAARQQADFMSRMRSCDRAERQRLSRLFTLMSTQANPVDPDGEYLLALGVLPEHQGLGAGKALVLDFIDRGERRGAGACELTVDRKNLKAGQLYRSLGFSPAGAAHNPVTQVTVDVLRRPRSAAHPLQP